MESIVFPIQLFGYEPDKNLKSDTKSLPERYIFAFVQVHQPNRFKFELYAKST